MAEQSNGEKLMNELSAPMRMMIRQAIRQFNGWAIAQGDDGSDEITDADVVAVGDVWEGGSGCYVNVWIDQEEGGSGDLLIGFDREWESTKKDDWSGKIMSIMWTFDTSADMVFTKNWS